MTSPGDSEFPDRFEALVLLLLEAPGDAEAHGRAAAACAAALATAPGYVEAGFERASVAAAPTLSARLLARQVDWVHAAAGTPAADLLAVARALASDGPVSGTDAIRVELVPIPIPADAPPLPAAGPGAPVPLLDDTASEAEGAVGRVTAQAADAARRRAWPLLLDRAEALLLLVEAAPPAERRTRLIAARRAVDRAALEGLVEHALRHPEDQRRLAGVLARIGPEGHEVAIDGIMAGESATAREFLHDALAAAPEAYPLLVPLLSRPKAYQARHGATLLGRLGDPRAIRPLAAALGHADALVRREAVRALAAFDDPAARAALTDALAHPDAGTRIDAAAAIADRRRITLAPALMSAFRGERESSVRRALAGAAARLGTLEALDELTGVALARRTLLRRDGEPVERRLDVVAGLAAARTPEARRRLDRIVRDGDGAVREAADQALAERRK